MNEVYLMRDYLIPAVIWWKLTDDTLGHPSTDDKLLRVRIVRYRPWEVSDLLMQRVPLMSGDVPPVFRCPVETMRATRPAGADPFDPITVETYSVPLIKFLDKGVIHYELDPHSGHRLICEWHGQRIYGPAVRIADAAMLDVPFGQAQAIAAQDGIPAAVYYALACARLEVG